MTRTTILAPFSVLVIGLLIPAYADNLSPLKQYNMGIPIDEIQCNDDKKLMQSSSGKPACVTVDTSVRLLDRGYSFVIFMKEEITFEENPSFEPEFVISDNKAKDSLSFSDAVETKIDHNSRETQIPLPIHSISKENNKIQLIIDPENVMEYIPNTGTIKHAFDISAWDHDELAQKIISITNDQITSQYQTPWNGTNYETTKGTIQIREDRVIYNLIGEHKIRNKVVKDFTLMFKQELGYPITDEVLYERIASGGDEYWFVQIKDNIFVEPSGIGTYTDGLHTGIYIYDWYENLDAIELYDYEEAKQFGKDYAMLFDELTNPSCNLIYNESFGNWRTSLKIIHGTPIYKIYAGNCEVNQPMHKASKWYANINALTGEPLYIESGGIL